MAIKESSWIPNLGAKGWGITVICIFFYFFYAFWNGATNTLLGIFTAMYGWDQTQMSFVISAAGWCSLLGIVVFGAIGRKIGARNVSAVSLLGTAIAFAILAMMTNFTMFVIGVVLFYVTMVGFAVTGLGKLGSNWFPRKKGIFMGMATMGMTLVSASINPIILACQPTIGINGFFWGCAVGCVILSAVVMAFVKNNPEEAGAFPDNDRSITRGQLEKEFARAEEYKKSSPWTVQKVLATKQTWLIGIGWGLPMLAGAGSIALLVPALMAFGHDQMFGVILLSSMWPIGLLGHYLIGVIDQKIGTKMTTVVVVAVETIGCLLVVLAGANAVACGVATGLLMFAISGNANVCMSMVTTVFGRQDFEMAWTPIQVIYNVFNFAGVFVMSLVGTLFGPTNILLGGVVICLVGLAIISLCPARQVGSQVSGTGSAKATAAAGAAD